MHIYIEIEKQIECLILAIYRYRMSDLAIYRYPHTSSSKNKNYLLSLYEHCRELAYLVSESESMSRGKLELPFCLCFNCFHLYYSYILAYIV